MISNDLLSAADSGLLYIVILLNLSAAFDTTLNRILSDRLESIGVIDILLTWFQIYFMSCTYFVQLKQFRSKSFNVNTGVPQGSTLGSSFNYYSSFTP